MKLDGLGLGQVKNFNFGRGFGHGHEIFLNLGHGLGHGLGKVVTSDTGSDKGMSENLGHGLGQTSDTRVRSSLILILPLPGDDRTQFLKFSKIRVIPILSLSLSEFRRIKNMNQPGW